MEQKYMINVKLACIEPPSLILQIIIFFFSLYFKPKAMIKVSTMSVTFSYIILEHGFLFCLTKLINPVYVRIRVSNRNN